MDSNSKECKLGLALLIVAYCGLNGLYTIKFISFVLWLGSNHFFLWVSLQWSTRILLPESYIWFGKKYVTQHFVFPWKWNSKKLSKRCERLIDLTLVVIKLKSTPELLLISQEHFPSFFISFSSFHNKIQNILFLLQVLEVIQ